MADARTEILIRQLQGSLGGRIVRGIVSSTGTVVVGSGFTASRAAAGDFSVVFATPLATVPSVDVSAYTTAGNDLIATVVDADTTVNGFRISIGSTTGTNTDAKFGFIAIG